MLGAGAIAWAPPNAYPDASVLPLGEQVERTLVHTADGARATLSPPFLEALECPELLTELGMHFAGRLIDALPALARTKRLRELTLTVKDSALAANDDTTVLAALPLESLTLTLPDSVAEPFPHWIGALPLLRSISLRYESAVDLTTAAYALPNLERLELSAVNALPAALSRFSGLRYLRVDGWRLRELPASLVELANLEELYVDPVRALPDVPEGFERLRALRTVRLGHLTTPEIPRALFRMPWLQRVELISARRWPESEGEALRHALPGAHIFVAFTGNAV